MCSGSRPGLPKPKRFLFSRHGRVPGAFERLADKDRLGVLHYTRYLTLRPKDIMGPRYNPRDVHEYLPYLRSITKLHTLTLVNFHIPPFTPVFNKYFGMFTNSLRHLEMRFPEGAEQDLLYLISQFHLLEDLTIVSSPGQIVPRPGHFVPTLTHSPPLRGNLALVKGRSIELSDGLAAFPGGLNFRSLELSWCTRPQALLAACGHTSTSISYFLRSGDDDSESVPLSRKIPRVIVVDCSDPVGSKTKRGAREI